MFGGFEWPEFRPGDRVMVRRPSEEEPERACGCKPSRAWDQQTQERGLSPDVQIRARVVKSEGVYPSYCPICLREYDLRGVRLASEDIRADHRTFLMPAINLELLEAAHD